MEIDSKANGKMESSTEKEFCNILMEIVTKGNSKTISHMETGNTSSTTTNFTKVSLQMGSITGTVDTIIWAVHTTKVSGCSAKRRAEDSCIQRAKPTLASGPTIQRWGKVSTFGQTKIDTSGVSHLTNCKEKENTCGTAVNQFRDIGEETKSTERQSS